VSQNILPSRSQNKTGDFRLNPTLLFTAFSDRETSEMEGKSMLSEESDKRSKHASAGERAKRPATCPAIASTSSIATTGNAAPREASDQQAKHRGAADGPVSKGEPSTVGASEKFWDKKEWRREVERERREQECKRKALLEEFGVTGQEVEQGWERDEVDGDEAAYEEGCEEEECRDLVGEYAGESAKKTGDAIGEVRDRYERIVMELLAARYGTPDGKRYSLASALRSEAETDGKLKGFLGELGELIKGYVLRAVIGEAHDSWRLNGQEDVRAVETLRGHAVSEGLLTALCVQYVKDPQGLKKFLSAMFKRWRKIHKLGSSWQIALVESQLRGRNDKGVAAAIEKSVLQGSPGTEKAHDRLMWRIRQSRKREKEREKEKKEVTPR